MPSRVRPALAVVGEPDWAPHLAPLPFADQVAQLLATVESPAALVNALPQGWVRELAIVGSPAEATAALRRVHAAGAQTVVLIPQPTTRSDNSTT